MRAASPWTLAALLALSVLACNEILDNRPGNARQEQVEGAADATQTVRGEDDVATPPASSSSAPAPAPTSEALTDSGPPPPEPPPASPCGESKFCGGACVSLDDSNHGCAAPGCAPCAVQGANAKCIGGACAIGSCLVGRGDCNALAADGCEVDLTLPASCGACGAVCPARPNAAPACSNGACKIACAPNFGDCNGDPLDGCETDLLTERTSCGMCGRICLLGSCVAGACTFP